MASEGFYKKTPEGILYAPQFVLGGSYELDYNWRTVYTYPVDGWYWFDDRSQAEAMFVEPAVVPVTAITKLAFRQRFTLAERVTLDLASIDNPAGSMPARQAADALRASQADLNASKWVDLARTDTQEGVLALENYGILAPGRAAVILSFEIQHSERP